MSNDDEIYVGTTTIDGIAWRSTVPARELTKIGSTAVCRTEAEAREAAAEGEFWGAATVHIGRRDENGTMQVIDTLRRGPTDDPEKWESGAPARSRLL